MKKFHWLALILAISCTACGTQWSGNYTGSWSGTVSGSPFQATSLAMTLYQSGSNINGYWLATGNNTTVSGQIAGSTSGNTLNATMTIPVGAVTQPGAGTYTGQLTLNSNALTGAVTGTSNGAAVTATVSLTQSR